MYTVAISTYYHPNISPKRLEMFKMMIDSLLPFNGKVYIVDDGSTCPLFWNYIESVKDISIIKKETNVGLSKVKNTSLKLIKESGVGYGFLCDDDLLFNNKEWADFYVDGIQQSGIQHFCFYPFSDYREVFYKDKWVRFGTWAPGAFLTITPQLIETIGYYKILPAKLGHEHTNYYLRAIKYGFTPHFGTDLVGSTAFLTLQDLNSDFSTRPDNFAEQLIENNDLGFSCLEKEPCIE